MQELGTSQEPPTRLRRQVSRRAIMMTVLAALSVVAGVAITLYVIELRRPLVAEVPGLGKFFIRDPNDMVESLLLQGQPWEPWTVSTFQKYVKPGMHVVDFGAYNGVHSIALAKLVGEKGRVYSFEPNPISFNLFKRNIKLNGLDGRIIAYPFAVSDHASNAGLVADIEHNLGGALLCTAEDIQAKVKGCEVLAKSPIQTVRIDDAVERWFPERIDFAKIDIEGHEDRLLAGARAWIKRDRPIIHVEIWNDTWRRYRNLATTRDQVIAMIQELGYHIAGTEKSTQNGQEEIQNYIFAPNQP
jgi:FkbM family methyltransferase